MSSIRRLAILIFSLLIIAGLYVGAAWLHLLGVHEGPGKPTDKRIPVAVVKGRAESQHAAAAPVGEEKAKQILFGDLHVHTTFSTDAFLWSLPMVQGTGAHPIADACDYARFCSALDFWSINDHAEASTPRRWEETRETIRECNAIAGDPANPDQAIFLGWEWSQVGATPADHYGHKNVIFRDLGDDQVPARVIGAAGIATSGLRGSIGQMTALPGLLDFPRRQRYFDFLTFMDEVRAVPVCPIGVDSRKLSKDCYESAATPEELFEKLDQWGFDTMVIPHGNTWGFYSPPGTTWDKQLKGRMQDERKQFLIEIMSGHGNSEQFRDWKDVIYDAQGKPHCPAPVKNYLPSCWRAGQIIEARCKQEGGSDAECAERAAGERQIYTDLGIAGHLTVPGATAEDWLDSGQCKDCFIPSFNYRAGGSTQYALAISNFDDPNKPRRFRFGIIASSDNHQARPGTGYKEFDRLQTTESAGPRDATWRDRLLGPPVAPLSKPNPVNAAEVTELGFRALEGERQSSFFMTGGLVAVHAAGRTRDDVWSALKRKEVYGTSGDRILLWFDLLNAGSDGTTRAPMGSEVSLAGNPRFEVRAVGAFRQNSGCPEYSVNSLDRPRLEWLCKEECYNPSDQRKKITRIEVVRIRPQMTPGEAVAPLIEDPWLTLPCAGTEEGCMAQFEDPDFAGSARGAVYYARAIEEPSGAINGGNLRCKYDDQGNCVEVHPCYGDYRTPPTDDCLTDIEERAWSSPIFVDPP